jgi:hypothetical protein
MGALAIIATAVSAIGAGVSYFSQRAAASTAETLAAANATTQLQAISQQRQLTQMQEAINAELARKDQAAANANADALGATADANAAASRESVRYSRLQAAKLAAANRAAMAKGAVDMSTGSPLALMAANEMESEATANRLVYENETERRALFRESAAHRNEGILAGINITGHQASGVAAAQAETQQAAQTRLNLYSERAAANAARTNATGSLLTNLGGIASDAYRSGVFGGKKPVKPNKYRAA